MTAAAAGTSMGIAVADKAAETEKDNFLISRFGALCFFLSAVEVVIPKPLPFLRLGISNVPLIIAAGFFSPASYALLALVKIVAQGLLGGTFFSWIFLFSAAGTIASAALMLLLKRALKSAVSAIGLSVAGAFASSIAQIAVARAWIFGETVLAIVPLLLAASVVTGLVVGVFAELFAQNSAWLAETKARSESSELLPKEKGSKPEAPGAPQENARRGLALSLLRVAAGFFFIILTGLFASPWPRAAVFVAFCVALRVEGQKPRLLPVLVSLVAITIFNLFPPRGEILAEIAGVRIAKDSLNAALSRAFFFEAIIFVSRWTFMPGKIKIPRGEAKGERRGRAARLFGRVFHLIAETIELFGKLNSSPGKKAERKPKGKKLSLEGAAAYIDSILQRIDSEPDAEGESRWEV